MLDCWGLIYRKHFLLKEVAVVNDVVSFSETRSSKNKYFRKCQTGHSKKKCEGLLYSITFKKTCLRLVLGSHSHSHVLSCVLKPPTIASLVIKVSRNTLRKSDKIIPYYFLARPTVSLTKLIPPCESQCRKRYCEGWY